MKTELGFLLDLFLNHKLPKVTRTVVAERIQEVEAAPRATPPRANSPLPPAVSSLSLQAPSTQALLNKHAGVEAAAAVEAPPSPEEGRPVGPPPDAATIAKRTQELQNFIAQTDSANYKANGISTGKGTYGKRKW